MTGASEDLLVAVYGLRRAAVERFTGNAYQSIANEIDELIQLLGPARENLPVGKGAAYGFATMLDEVRRLARTSTSGSQYSAITHKLDILASHLASGASAPAPAARVSAIPAAVAAPASASVAATAPAAALAVSASVPVTPPAGLLEAVYGLRRAAEAQFIGNTYYQVANEITDLTELLGLHSGSVPVGQGASYGFATMLAEIRKAAEACTSTGRRSAIAHKLDVLASYVAPAATAPAAPASTPVTPPAGLLEAVYGLRRAAEAQFTGNAYYQVANEITDLTELLGLHSGSVPVGQGASYGFATMLAEIRKASEACTSTGRRAAIAHKLDVLASHLAPATPASEKLAAAVAPAPAHPAAPSHREAEVLETRSSEPCSMAELAPVAAEPVAAAAEAAPACPFHAKFEETAELLAAEPAAAPMPADHADLAAAHEAAHGPSGGVCPFHAMPADTAGEPTAEPVAEPAAPVLSALAGREKIASFDELAATSKARVEQVAASLGVVPAHHVAPSQPEPEAEAAPVATVIAAAEPAPAAVEAPGERRLESRSSGDATPALECVEPVVVPAKAAAEPRAQEAAPDLGSPAAKGQAAGGDEIAAGKGAAMETAAKPAVAAASGLAPGAVAGAPVQKIEVKLAEPKRKEPKNLFKLWLDLAFGRKD